MKWEMKALDDLGFVSRGKSKHRPRNAPNLYGEKYPFIQTADVKHSNLYINEVTQYYSEAGLEQSKLWAKGTLCITIAANIADTAILGIDACFPDSIIGFIADEDKCDVKFIKYQFNLMQKHYQSFSQGATQDNLSQAKLLSLKFPTPSLPIQKKIASILSAYDDLIENNLRRIELLEKAARELYKEWFVRFKFPGHEKVKFKDGLPEGWERKKLGDVCYDVRESVNPNDLSPDIPYIGLEHIPRRSITLSNWDFAKKVNSSKYFFKSGDILFGKIRPYFHKVGFTIIEGITSSDSIVIRVYDAIDYYFTLLLLSSDYFIKYVSTTVKEGSKMPRADWKTLKLQYEVIIPNQEILLQFNYQISSILKILKNLTEQNQFLKQTRDLLLPRLMKGEIEV